MSWPLFRLSVKKHGWLWLLFLGILMMYLMVIASIYEPSSMQSIDALLHLLPSGLISAFGFQTGMTSLTGFIVSYFFGFLIHIITLFYTLLLTSSLVVKLVDDGSISYLLTTPLSRGRFAATQMHTLYGSLLGMYLVLGGLSTLGISLLFPGLLDRAAYLRCLGYALLVNLSVASFAMLCSCVFSTTRKAMGVATGVSVLLLLLQMIGNIGSRYAWMKRLTPYGWLDALAVMNGDPAVLPLSVLLLILWAMLASAGYVVFTRKQLAV